jgi:hypothetical protein
LCCRHLLDCFIQVFFLRRHVKNTVFFYCGRSVLVVVFPNQVKTSRVRHQVVSWTTRENRLAKPSSNTLGKGDTVRSPDTPKPPPLGASSQSAKSQPFNYAVDPLRLLRLQLDTRLPMNVDKKKHSKEPTSSSADAPLAQKCLSICRPACLRLNISRLCWPHLKVLKPKMHYLHLKISRLPRGHLIETPVDMHTGLPSFEHQTISVKRLFRIYVFERPEICRGALEFRCSKWRILIQGDEIDEVQ